MYFAYSTLAVACFISLLNGQHDGKYTSNEENDNNKKSNEDIDSSFIENHSFMALIDIVFTVGRKKTCTGSIIHDNVVLTAAHCFIGFSENSKPELTASFVVIGTKTMFDTGYEQYLPIERIVIHPKFKGWTADLALVYTFAGMTSDKPGTVIPLAGEKASAHVDANVTLLSWVRVHASSDYEDSSCDSSRDEERITTKYNSDRYRDDYEHDSDCTSSSSEETNGRTDASRNKKKTATVPMYRLLRDGATSVREKNSQFLIEKKNSNQNMKPIVHTKERFKTTLQHKYPNYGTQRLRSKKKFDPAMRDTDIPLKGFRYSHNGNERIRQAEKSPIMHNKRQNKTLEQLYIEKLLHKYKERQQGSKIQDNYKRVVDIESSEKEEGIGIYLNASERILSDKKQQNSDIFYFPNIKETFQNSPKSNNHYEQRLKKKYQEKETEDIDSTGTEEERATLTTIGHSRYLNERIRFDKKLKRKTSRRRTKSTTRTVKKIDSSELTKNDNVEVYVQKIKPQIFKFKSYFKNWRRTMGSQQHQLKVENFGFVSLQQCQALVEKATSIFGEHDISKTKDVVCYASRDSYVITDADSGAPAIRHGQLVAVTVGGAEFEGDHVAIGMKMSCYCSWIAENLPNGGDNMNCCKNCCQVKHKEETHRDEKHKYENNSKENHEDENHQNEKHKKYKHRFRVDTFKRFTSRYFLELL